MKPTRAHRIVAYIEHFQLNDPRTDLGVEAHMRRCSPAHVAVLRDAYRTNINLVVCLVCCQATQGQSGQLAPPECYPYSAMGSRAAEPFCQDQRRALPSAPVHLSPSRLIRFDSPGSGVCAVATSPSVGFSKTFSQGDQGRRQSSRRRELWMRHS